MFTIRYGFSAALCTIGLTVLLAVSCEEKPAKPNIVFILADDLGETVNLADSLKSKTDELATDLQNWRNQVNA